MKKKNAKWICAVMLCLLAGTAAWFGRSASAATLTDSEGNTSVDAIVVSEVEGQKVYTLTSDITNGLIITLENGETAILDGNGRSVSGRNATTNGYVVDCEGSVGLTVNGNGTLIIRNITVTGGNSASNIYNDSYSGATVSDGCNIRLENNVTLKGGSAGDYRPTTIDPGNSGAAGMVFGGNCLWIAGSGVTIQGSDSKSNGYGGNALEWSGRVYQYEQNAAALTPGVATMEAGYGYALKDNGKAMGYECGLLQTGSVNFDDLGFETSPVTIKQVAGESVLSTRDFRYMASSTISDLNMLPFASLEGYDLIGIYSDAALTNPIEAIDIETEVVYYAFKTISGGDQGDGTADDPIAPPNGTAPVTNNNPGTAIVTNQLNCTLSNAIIQCEYSTQGEECKKAFLAAMPQGCKGAFTFNLLLQENGSFQPSYALRNGQFVMEIPKEWQKKGRTFALIGVDRSGKTKIFTDEDISDETFTTSLDIEGYAYSLIYSDTDAIPASGRYAVQAGDSLSRIARKLQVSISHLVIKNKLSNPNKIQVGQELFY